MCFAIPLPTGVSCRAHSAFRASMKESRPDVSGSKETTIFSPSIPHIFDRLGAPSADLRFVLLEAVQQSPLAGFHGRTVSSQVIAALIGHIAQRIDGPLELDGGIVQRELAAVRQLVPVRIEAGQEPPLARCSRRRFPCCILPLRSGPRLPGPMRFRQKEAPGRLPPGIASYFSSFSLLSLLHGCWITALHRPPEQTPHGTGHRIERRKLRQCHFFAISSSISFLSLFPQYLKASSAEPHFVNRSVNPA